MPETIISRKPPAWPHSKLSVFEFCQSIGILDHHLLRALRQIRGLFAHDNRMVL